MKKIIIYGAGVYGRRVLESLRRKNVDVSFFVVTHKQNNISYVDGIPVYSLSDLNIDSIIEYNIIVATNELYFDEIKNSIKKNFGDLILNNVLFYKKSDIDRLYRETHPFEIKSFLSSCEPVSRFFGNDRGTPIDRYYIEKFLERESNRLDISGHILEVGDNRYSRLFFSQCENDILDYSKGMDLTKPDTLPKNKYECFICTQVFHQIYDVKRAIEGAYYLLKRNGILLATVCGCVSKLAKNDEYEHFWGFTCASIERLIKSSFGNQVEIEPYGNAMAATAFIQGLSVEEIDSTLLENKDEEFVICISIVARKTDERLEHNS